MKTILCLSFLAALPIASAAEFPLNIDAEKIVFLTDTATERKPLYFKTIEGTSEILAIRFVSGGPIRSRIRNACVDDSQKILGVSYLCKGILDLSFSVFGSHDQVAHLLDLGPNSTSRRSGKIQTNSGFSHSRIFGDRPFPRAHTQGGFTDNSRSGEFEVVPRLPGDERLIQFIR